MRNKGFIIQNKHKYISVIAIVFFVLALSLLIGTYNVKLPTYNDTVKAVSLGSHAYLQSEDGSQFKITHRPSRVKEWKTVAQINVTFRRQLYQKKQSQLLPHQQIEITELYFRHIPTNTDSNLIRHLKMR